MSRVHVAANDPQNYDEICVSEVPEPIQKDGEVLVRVEAAGLNFVDLLYVRNLDGCLVKLHASHPQNLFNTRSLSISSIKRCLFRS